MNDPYADKKSPWPKIILALLVLAGIVYMLNKMGFIYQWTDGRLGTEKPLISRKAAAESATPKEAAPKPADSSK